MLNQSMNFDRTTAIKALSDPTEISGAFLWHESPQGLNFWGREDDRAIKGKPLSRKGEAALIDLIYASYDGVPS